MFKIYDVNNNGGIDFGSEFDNFLAAFLPLCGPDFKNLPKD
jgi:hypothetical protein